MGYYVEKLLKGSPGGFYRKSIGWESFCRRAARFAQGEKGTLDEVVRKQFEKGKLTIKNDKYIFKGFIPRLKDHEMSGGHGYNGVAINRVVSPNTYKILKSLREKRKDIKEVVIHPGISILPGEFPQIFSIWDDHGSPLYSGVVDPKLLKFIFMTTRDWIVPVPDNHVPNVPHKKDQIVLELRGDIDMSFGCDNWIRGDLITYFDELKKWKSV